MSRRHISIGKSMCGRLEYTPWGKRKMRAKAKKEAEYAKKCLGLVIVTFCPKKKLKRWKNNVIVGKCHAGKALMYNGGGQHDLDDVGRVMPLQQEFPAQIMNMLINIILENIIFQSIIFISIMFGRCFHAFY